ncbi:MAG: hypothetical protein JWP81_2442 [Ferruginibacter sp.]|nr:hypothetical protein [Ferruginibacter sp.]
MAEVIALSFLVTQCRFLVFYYEIMNKRSLSFPINQNLFLKLLVRMAL